MSVGALVEPTAPLVTTVTAAEDLALTPYEPVESTLPVWKTLTTPPPVEMASMPSPPVAEMFPA